MTGPEPFERQEFRARCERAQEAMAKADLAALLLTSEADFRYFSGFLTRFWESPTRPWFLVLPADDAPVAVIPDIGAALMASTWIRDIRTWPSPDYRDDGVSLLTEVLRNSVPKGGRIGTPMGRETHLRMPLADWDRLRSFLSDRKFVDAAPLLRDLHMVKSSAEIACIREACAIAGRAFARIPELVHPGATLADVFRRFQMLLLDEGADWVSYLAGGAGQGGYADVISPAREAALKCGDVLMLDTGAVRHGYFCDFDRNWAIGTANDATKEAHHVLFEATEAGFAAARPGATPRDVHSAMKAHLTAHGYGPVGGRLGHGLGMRLTEPPSLIPDDDTELRPGTVLTLEPWLPTGSGRMMVHEEVICIGEDGPHWLSPRGPRDIPVLEWPV